MARQFGKQALSPLQCRSCERPQMFAHWARVFASGGGSDGRAEATGGGEAAAVLGVASACGAGVGALAASVALIRGLSPLAHAVLSNDSDNEPKIFTTPQTRPPALMARTLHHLALGSYSRFALPGELSARGPLVLNQWHGAA